MFFAGFLAVFCYTPAYACEPEEMFVQGECQMPKFSVQVQYDEEGGGDFGFDLNATGDFFVDWGDGNTEEIHRDMESTPEYQHNYENGGSYTIKFAGLATGYPNDDEMPAIKFGQRPGHDHIVGISGNLISIFPVFDPGDSTMSPGFRETFSDCHNLTEIPANLFGGVEGTILGGRPYMFANTFANSGVTFIPSHLFAGINSAQDHIFESVFANNQQMTGFIPESAFQGWVNANFPSSPEGMWGGAFGGTQLDTSCPDGINQVITGFEDDWGGYVMCSGENSTGSGGGGGGDEPTGCTGEYYGDGDECFRCPEKYRYDDGSGTIKTTINDCQVMCPAGTWVDQPDVSTVGSGYTRLEYLTSKANQYIDTGHPHGSEYIRGVIRVGTDVDVTTNVNIIGNQIGGGGNGTSGYSVGWSVPQTNKPGNAFKVWVNSSNNRLNGVSPHMLSAGTIHDVEYRLTPNHRWIKYDGVELDDVHAGRIQTTNNIHLFDNGVHDSNQHFFGKIYYIKIYEKENEHAEERLVHNYLPAKNNDNVIGILDTVTGEFWLPPANGGAFTLDQTGDEIADPCVPVGAGYYSGGGVAVNLGDVGERQPCPLGTYSTDENADSIEACQACPSDKYGYMEGAMRCKDCPASYDYGSQEGKEGVGQCKTHCNVGTWNPGYTKLEYLESNGTQYINTGFSFTNNATARIVIDTAFTQVTNSYQGNGVKGDTFNGPFVGYDSNKKLAGAINGYFTTNVNATVNTRYLYDLDAVNHTFTVTNVNTGAIVASKDDFDNTSVESANRPPFMLFGFATAANNATKHKAKIYSAKLYDKGIIKRDMVPVRRNSDGAYGMFDIVTGNFYGMVGSGVFTAGPEIGGCFNVGPGYYAGESIVDYEYSGNGPRNQCPAGLTTIGYGNGADEENDCGRVLHVGDNILYLRSNKKTTPALNFDINGDGVPDLYGNMSTTDLPMSDGLIRKLMLRYNDQTYYACDESVSGCQQASD